METTDYCNYKLSLALKECGFDEPCRCCYVVDKDTESNIKFAEYTSRNRWNSVGVGGSKYPYKHISAPTLWHAQKWLREKGGIDVDVRTTKIPKRKYGYVVYDKTQHFSHEEYYAYEQALSAGISAALELIKEGE